MKKSYKDTKIKTLVFLTGLLFSFSLMAKPVAVVNSVEGNVFGIIQGKTKVLTAGEHIPDSSEIITEEGAQVTFADYHDHKFHLAGSGHIKIGGNITELVAGYLWVQSYHQSVEDFIVQTANSIITYKDGEAIVSYDKVNGRTQIYSLNDSFEIAHVLEKSFKEVVDKGQFTFIDNDFENGAPRKPTELGHSSYEKIRGLFYKIHPIDADDPMLKRDEETLPHRDSNLRIPASVDDKKVKESQIIYLLPDKKQDQRLKDEKLNSFYQQKVTEWSVKPKKKKFKPNYEKLSGVTIKIFGGQSTSSVAQVKKESSKVASTKAVEVKKDLSSSTSRMPASISSAEQSEKSGFEGSLMEEYTKQMRHSNEVNSLIKDLQNYKQDYKSDY